MERNDWVRVTDTDGKHYKWVPGRRPGVGRVGGVSSTEYAGFLDIVHCVLMLVFIPPGLSLP